MKNNVGVDIKKVAQVIAEKETKDKTYGEWHYSELVPSVVEFNSVVGGVFTDKTLEEKAKAINLQIEIVREELFGEFFMFYSKDMVEELDAIADVLFTASYLDYQLSVIDELPDDDKEILNQLLNLDALEVVNSLGLKSFYERFTRHYDLDIIVEATQRVIENNKQKYTADKEVAEKWKSPKSENLVLSERVYNDVTFYCLVNSVGKVRKKVGFKGVVLADLAEKQLTRFNSGEVSGDANEETQ